MGTLLHRLLWSEAQVDGAVGERQRQQRDPEPYAVRREEVEERTRVVALLVDRKPWSRSPSAMPSSSGSRMLPMVSVQSQVARQRGL